MSWGSKLKVEDGDDDDNDDRHDIYLFRMFVQRKVVSLFSSSRDHCNRSSPSRISGLVEWSCVAVTTTTLQPSFVLWEVISEIKKLHQGLGFFLQIQFIFWGVRILKWILSPNVLIVWCRMECPWHWKLYFSNRVWIFPGPELRLYEMNLSCS